MSNIPLRKARTRKPAFDKFGLGAIALYVAGVVVVACAVYGINLSAVINKFNESERLRAQAQRGEMLIGTRIARNAGPCASTTIPRRSPARRCSHAPPSAATDSRSAGSTLSGFRDGFAKR